MGSSPTCDYVMATTRVVIDDDNSDIVCTGLQSLNKAHFETIDLENEDTKENSKGNSSNKIPKPIMLLNEKITLKTAKKIHPLLAEFSQECIRLDDSRNMQRVLNLLLKSTKYINEEYIASEKFIKLLNTGIKCLKVNPQKKFTYIKMVLDHMKLYNKLIIPGRNEIRSDESRKEKNVISLLKENNGDTGTINDDVIELDRNNMENDLTIIVDCEEVKSSTKMKDKIVFEDSPKYSLLNIASYETDNIEHNQEFNHNNIRKPEDTVVSNIVNLENSDDEIEFIDTCTNKSKELLLKYNESKSVNSKVIINAEEQTAGKYLNPSCSEGSNHLLPVRLEELQVEMSVEDKIKTIENEIEIYKKKIEQYEEIEVENEDDKHSPYIIVSGFKEKVVKLYKELCTLSGGTHVKRCQIRIKVLEGVPQGPAVRLEELINSNVSEDGCPPFPDFNDVLSCVRKANCEDKLGWNATQIVTEAQCLFMQCGKALQKRRQKRDWRAMASRVRQQDLDEDPADKDPELLSKLENNRREAMARENKLFEKFAMKQSAMSSLTVRSQDSDSEVEESVIVSGIAAENTDVPVKKIKLERIDHSTVFLDNSIVIEVSDTSDSDSS